jgi:hypothetical protein
MSISETERKGTRREYDRGTHRHAAQMGWQGQAQDRDRVRNVILLIAIVVKGLACTLRADCPPIETRVEWPSQDLHSISRSVVIVNALLCALAPCRLWLVRGERVQHGLVVVTASWLRSRDRGQIRCSVNVVVNRLGPGWTPSWSVPIVYIVVDNCIVMCDLNGIGCSYSSLGLCVLRDRGGMRFCGSSSSLSLSLDFCLMTGRSDLTMFVWPLGSILILIFVCLGLSNVATRRNWQACGTGSLPARAICFNGGWFGCARSRVDQTVTAGWQWATGVP